MKRLACLMLLCEAFSLSAAELPPPLASLSSQVIEQPATVLEFDQLQAMPLLEMPLQLSGRLVVIPDQGLLWVTDTPFPDKQLMALDGQIYTAFGSQDGHPLMTRLLLAVFGFDQELLREYFDISLSGDGQEWQVTLAPTVDWLSTQLLSVSLSGASELNEILINNADGGYSRYLISDIGATSQDAVNSMSASILPKALRGSGGQ